MNLVQGMILADLNNSKPLTILLEEIAVWFQLSPWSGLRSRTTKDEPGQRANYHLHRVWLAF